MLKKIKDLKQKLKDLLKNIDQMTDIEIYEEIHRIDGFARYHFKMSEEQKSKLHNSGAEATKKYWIKKNMQSLANNNQIKKYDKQTLTKT